MTQDELLEYLKQEYDKQFALLKRQIDLAYADYSNDIKYEIKAAKNDIGTYKPGTKHNKKIRELDKRIDKRTDELFEEVSSLFNKTMSNCYDLGYKGTRKSIYKSKVIKPEAYQAMKKKDMKYNLWSGMHYDERIQNHKEKLVFTLKSKITSSIIRDDSLGYAYNDAYKSIQNQLKALDRLCKTEMNAMVVMGQLRCYHVNNILEIQAVLDERCCDECKRHDGKKVKVLDAKVGINIPPFHTSCRCSVKEVKKEEQ